MKHLLPFVALTILAVLVWSGCNAYRDQRAWRQDRDSTLALVQAKEDSADRMLALGLGLWEAGIRKDSLARLSERRGASAYRAAINLRDSLEGVAIPDTCLPLASGWRRTNDSLKVAYDSTKGALDSLRSASAQRDTAKAAFLDVVKLKGESVGDLSALVRRAPGPCRALGFLPCPQIQVGYGAVLSDGEVRVGPSVGIGFKVPF